jgi:hypothetical protein
VQMPRTRDSCTQAHLRFDPARLMPTGSRPRLYSVNARTIRPAEHYTNATVLQGCERHMFGLYPSHGSLAHST